MRSDKFMTVTKLVLGTVNAGANKTSSGYYLNQTNPHMQLWTVQFASDPEPMTVCTAYGRLSDDAPWVNVMTDGLAVTPSIFNIPTVPQVQFLIDNGGGSVTTNATMYVGT